MPEHRNKSMTLDKVKEVIEVAQMRGTEAAAAKYAQMCRKDRRRASLRGLCGGAHIMIKLDGRTRLARRCRAASAAGRASTRPTKTGQERCTFSACTIARSARLM